jgi:hypothetical protein
MYKEHTLCNFQFFNLVTLHNQLCDSFECDLIATRSHNPLIYSFLYKFEQRCCLPPIVIFLWRFV